MRIRVREREWRGGERREWNWVGIASREGEKERRDTNRMVSDGEGGGCGVVEKYVRYPNAIEVLKFSCRV